MKKIIALVGAATFCAALGTKKCYAWSGVTHKDITEKSLKLLEKDKKIKAVTFFKDYHNDILKGCIEPDDENDMDCGLGKHYYSCVNPKGKELKETGGYYKNRLGKLNPSARTMLEQNYTSAVSLYKSNKKNAAMVMLGRAIHFLSDMGCTVHVADMKYLNKPNNVHYAMERHITTTCTRHTAETFDKRLTKYYSKDNLGEAIHKLTKFASKFTDTISHLDPRGFDDAASSTLPVIQQNVMALMLKFMDDCTTDNGNYALDGKMYSFRNAVSGLLITVTPKGLALEEADKSLEQKMQLCYTDKGTFGIKVADGGYVAANCKSYDYLKIDGEPAQFRLWALGRKQFRITTGSTEFEKVLANSKGGSISITDFDPENNAQIWILN